LTICDLCFFRLFVFADTAILSITGQRGCETRVVVVDFCWYQSPAAAAATAAAAYAVPGRDGALRRANCGHGARAVRAGRPLPLRSQPIRAAAVLPITTTIKTQFIIFYFFLSFKPCVSVASHPFEHRRVDLARGSAREFWSGVDAVEAVEVDPGAQVRHVRSAVRPRRPRELPDCLLFVVCWRGTKQG
jgi:hypothetical protein